MRKGSRRGPSHLCACRLALLAALALGTSVAIAAPGPSIRYSPERIDVALELDAPALTEVREADGGRYVDVALDGHPSRAHPGEPALPVVEIWLETPRRSPRPHVWLEDARWEDAVLSAPVRPAREPVPKTPGELARRRFVRDESFYRGGGLRNPWAERLSTWYRLTPVRRSKVDYFRLELFLHRFDPEALRLRFPRRIEVSIGWRGGPAASRAYAARGAGETRILEVDLTGDHALPALVKAGYDIAGRRGSEVTIYATAKEESALREAGFEVRRLPNEAPRKARDLRSKGSKDDPPGVYRTPEQVGEFLADLVALYPDLCRRESIGQSVEGREIWAIKVSDNAAADESEPEVRIASSLHGDEPPGIELCLYLLDHLLGQYGADPRVTRIVDGLEIWIIPLANPDGYAAGSRYNAHSVDLNRAFPDRILDPVNSPEGREPEVAALMSLGDRHRFVLGANLHTGALVVNYPYDSNESGESINTPSPDDATFRYLSLRYAEPNDRLWTSAVFPHGITNGAEWYVVYGGLQDWGYEWNGTLELTLEVWEEKWPAAAELAEIWESHRGSLLAFLETAFTAAAGTVRDDVTGEVLADASVVVEGIDRTTPVDPRDGRFHRVLEPGSYALTARAPGYEPFTMADVVVEEGATAEIEIRLSPAAASRAERVLVVSHESLAAGALAMVEHYISRGYPAEHLPVSGGPTADDVRGRIREVYAERPFDFLLLVGDTDSLPAFSQGAHVSDLLYSLLDSGEGWDDFAGRDVLAARLPVRSADEALEYRQRVDAFLGSPRDRRFAWISHGYSGGECAVALGTHEWVIANAAPAGAVHARFPCDEGSAQEFCDRVNEGVDVVTYSGHGGADAWARWDFDNGDLACLAAGENPPIVFSHACETGRFEIETCFGEAWIAGLARGVAFVGASDSTYWDEDDWLERREFQDLLGDPGESLGRSLLSGLEDVASRSSRGSYYHEIYHILGDPTLRLRGSLGVGQVTWLDAGDSIPEPGESGDLDVVLINRSAEPIRSILASLGSTSGDVELPAEPLSLGELEAGGERAALFPLRISAACGAGAEIPLTLDVAFEGGFLRRELALGVHVVSRVAGRVTLEESGDPVPDAVVETAGPQPVSAPTDGDGRFAMDLIEGTYVLGVEIPGHLREEIEISVPPGREDIALALGWCEGLISPAEVEVTAAGGESLDVPLRLRNPGNRPLSFRASFAGGTGGGTCPSAWDYSLCAEGEDPPGWADTSAGIAVSSGDADDDVWGPFSLPFAFPFFGDDHDLFFISSNGLISFQFPAGDYQNRTLPSSAAPPLALAALWDDLSVPFTGAVRRLQGGDRVVIEFRDVKHYDGSPAFSFQVHLEPTGRIVLLYRDVPWSQLTATVGVQDGSRTRGLTVDPPALGGGPVLLCGAPSGEPPGECVANHTVISDGDPGWPAPAWQDTDGAVVVHSGYTDDQVWGPYSLSFPFEFFAVECREIYLSSNGFAAFVPPEDPSYENRYLPSATAPRLLVAPLWDDLEILDSGSVRILDGADRTVIEYRDVAHYDGGGRFSFQILLERDGSLFFLYRDVDWARLTPTVGIQDGSGAEGLTVGPGRLGGAGVQITQRPSWAEVSPEEGVVGPGGEETILLRLEGTEIDRGVRTTLRLATNSPREERIEVPVTVLPPSGDIDYFLRGDADQDGSTSITDALAALQHLFMGRNLPCLRAGDSNGDGLLNITDPIYLLGYLFLGGPAPPPPFPECGAAPPAPGPLTCEVSACAP